MDLDNVIIKLEGNGINMRKGNLLIGAMTVAILLSGCQSNADNNETEALKAQIERLEQQVAELEQQKGKEEAGNGESDGLTGEDTAGKETADVDANTANGTSVSADNDVNSQSANADNNVDNQTANTNNDISSQPSDTNNSGENKNNSASANSTTYTMQELSDMVDAYVEKAKAASPSGDASADMEQFFSLKQEEKQIDDKLDVHEDELEYLYRNNSLTRDEYTKMERELEQLEDKLDDVEDRLEFMYGIDD